MERFDLTGFPDECADTDHKKVKKGEQISKSVTWADCSDNCEKCVPCDPNLKSDCGQMVSDSGIGCVPPACASKCCNSSNPSNPSKPSSPSNPSKPSSPSNIETPAPTSRSYDTPFYKTTSGKVTIGIGTIAGVVGIVVLIAFMIKRRTPWTGRHTILLGSLDRKYTLELKQDVY
jgi:hypothetical protein